MILESLRNKNYKRDLSGKSRIIRGGSNRQWNASFSGEEKVEKRLRAGAVTGFQKAVTQCIRNNIKTAALVIHGGTIMNIMEEICGQTQGFL